MTLTDATAPHTQPAQSRVRKTLDRIPTLVYLAVAAGLVVGMIALFGGLNDGAKTHATAKVGEAIDVGIADVTIDEVRLHDTDYWGDPAESGEFLTLRVTVTNTSDSTYAVTELITIGTFEAPVYGVEAIAIDEDVTLEYPTIRTAVGDSSVQLGPHVTQTYDVTFAATERLDDRKNLSLVFAPSQYTPNKFLRDTSDGYYETLPTIALGEFPITDETAAP